MIKWLEWFDSYPLSWWHWALLMAIAVFCLLPPKVDPAIKLKDWVERKFRRG